MKHEFNLLKMRVEHSNPVSYFFSLPDKEIFVNDLTEKKIKISWTGEINCIKCGNKTKKTFFQGFCYPCYMSAPEAAPCIIHPEECEAHLGKARDLEWSKNNCLTTHYVYIALSSGIKVGVTRSNQIPTRWIDQGAAKAVIFAETPDRHTAGLIEVNLKQHFADKTNWQKMLKNDIDLKADLLSEKFKAKKLLRTDLFDYITDDTEIFEFNYPVSAYPEKVKAVNFEKMPEISGKLTGIKGQYLIFDNNFVLNIRKYGGYKIILEY